MIAACAIALAAGVLLGRRLPRAPRVPSPRAGSVPFAETLTEFREFVRNLEGGAVPEETESVLQSLEAHTKKEALSPSKPLIGEACEEFMADLKSALSPVERGNVILRWHAKGYVFPSEVRINILRAAVNEQSRRRAREIFDEQDRVAGSVTIGEIRTEPR